jgi:deoxyribodipyrimidine photo-lyase
MAESSVALPAPTMDGATAWVHEFLGALVFMDPIPQRSMPIAESAGTIRGGQQAADSALAAFDVTGYARRRNEVWPPSKRGASRLSPYIRHGLITLPELWDHVASGPPADVETFRSELLWQEYARHLYARVGVATRRSLRFAVPERDQKPTGDWPAGMRCVDMAVAELRSSGWIPNQTRMWLASQWSVREGWGWRDGEDLFFRMLLDGSRAANRLGWQWTTGALTGKVYGFSRWQVTKRAPGLCESCPLASQCPIEDWPPEDPPEARAYVDPAIRRDPDVAATAGPEAPVVHSEPDLVWLTAESLGRGDPALIAHPELPVHFVFDAPLLSRLRLGLNRFVFLAETLADLHQSREVIVWKGDPTQVLQGRQVAVTFAPVPGARSRRSQINPVAVYPWPWLVPPHAGSMTSFTAWRRQVRV